MQTDIDFLASILPKAVGALVGIAIAIGVLHGLRAREKRSLKRDVCFGLSIWVGTVCNSIVRELFPALKEQLVLGSVVAILIAGVCVAPYLVWAYLRRSRNQKPAAS